MSETETSRGTRGIRPGVAGISLVFFLSGFAALLYEMSTADPLSIAAAAIILAAVTLLAGWIPARRAAQIDPMTALREE